MTTAMLAAFITWGLLFLVLAILGLLRYLCGTTCYRFLVAVVISRIHQPLQLEQWFVYARTVEEASWLARGKALALFPECQVVITKVTTP